MYQNDWDDFIQDITWLITPEDKVIVSKPVLAKGNTFLSSGVFTNMFPHMTKLLDQARVTDIYINDNQYYLMGWTDKEENSFGWLCMPPSKNYNDKLSKEHNVLLSCFGGITERWNENEDSWLCNLNYALIEDTLTEFEDDYYFEGEYEPQINPNDYIVFAYEANGNLTLYNKENSKVIMAAHDHCFEHITPLGDYPEYTLYEIIECPDFVTWVENIAIQNLRRIEE